MCKAGLSLHINSISCIELSCIPFHTFATWCKLECYQCCGNTGLNSDVTGMMERRLSFFLFSPLCVCVLTRARYFICMPALMLSASLKLPTNVPLCSLESCLFFFLHLNADSGNLQHSPTGSSGQAAIERPQGITVSPPLTPWDQYGLAAAQIYTTTLILGSTNFWSLSIKPESDCRLSFNYQKSVGSQARVSGWAGLFWNFITLEPQPKYFKLVECWKRFQLK